MKVIQAIKKIYPTIQGGFVYWETKEDGSPHKNPIDGLLWENTEFTKPTWEQIKAQLSIVELEEAKATKLSQLAKNREFKAEKSSVEYNGKPYANSQNARIAINDARQLMAASSPAVSYFTCPTDESGKLIAEQREIVEFTKADFAALADLIRNNERSLREQEFVIIQQINNCQDLEKLANININFE